MENFDVIQKLLQSINTVDSEARHIKSVADHANSSGLAITEVCWLLEETKRLATITGTLKSTIDELNEAAENSIIKNLKLLVGQDATTKRPLIQELLSHFDAKIRSIIREVITKTIDQDVLYRTAEECYTKFLSPDTLTDNDDAISQKEAALYSGHEDRLDVEDDYDAASKAPSKQCDQAEVQKRQDWIDFWFKVLNNSPAGPTLFCPPAISEGPYLGFDPIPRYLFRTFDKTSSGKNDESVIASMTSVFGSPKSSRVDLLALEKHEAARLLHMHLVKDCFGGDKSDNLMSWTSSLLFAIQYAIWRLRHRIRGSGCGPSDVKICAVDTEKFPLGQFAQVPWLFEACRTSEEQEEHPQDREEMFYDEEYISQGAVNHENRSQVISLEQLIRAGLLELYPELMSVKDGGQLGTQILELRQIWSGEQETTDREIELALQIGNQCFSQFPPLRIAAMLLSFKNRSYSRPYTTKPPDYPARCLPKWADKPVEVRRYWTMTETTSFAQPNLSQQPNPLQHHKTLREILE